MKLSHFFIDHPRFAAVVNIFIMVFGLAAASFLPVAQYPNIVPPTVQIQAVYPGASAETIARTVATPLEQAINGVENMDYITSQSTSNGQLTITVIFKIGTNIAIGCSPACWEPQSSSSPRRCYAGTGAASVSTGAGSRAVAVSADLRSRPKSAIWSGQ
jgi:hypothetical protein